MNLTGANKLYAPDGGSIRSCMTLKAIYGIEK